MGIKRVIKLFIKPYYIFRNNWIVWRLYNIHGTLRYLLFPPHLNTSQKKILAELNENGIAITHLSELFPEISLRKLQEYTKQLSQTEVKNPKNFWRDLWNPDDFLISKDNPFIEFALKEKILQIGASYMKMWLRLITLRNYRTKIMPKGQPPIQSQLWHRDPGDKLYFKVLLYLNDVDSTTGPFYYIKKSHNIGKYKNIFPQRLPLTYEKSRFSDKQIEKNNLKSNVKKCTGNAGTMIFVDTTGLHKGGYSAINERSMFIAQFASRVQIAPFWKRDKLTLDPYYKNHKKSLTPMAQFALSKPLIEIP